MYIAGLVVFLFPWNVFRLLYVEESWLFILYIHSLVVEKFSSKLKPTTKRSNPPWSLWGAVGERGGRWPEPRRRRAGIIGAAREGKAPPFFPQQIHLPWKQIPPGWIGATPPPPSQPTREREKNSGKRAGLLVCSLLRRPAFGRRPQGKAQGRRLRRDGGGRRAPGGEEGRAGGCSFDISFTRSHVSLTPTLVAEPR